MKRPLITRIINHKESPIIMDVAPGFPRIYVGSHKKVDYPGDIFTVVSEAAMKSLLKLNLEKVNIEYLTWNGTEYESIWNPVCCSVPADKVAPAKEPVITETAKGLPKEPTVTVKEAPKEEPVKVKDVTETISTAAEAPEEEPVITEEAPAVDDFFTTTVEDTTEDTKKTAKKRKAK